MVPSLGQLIASRAKRDPVFKRQTLKALRKKLKEAKSNTEAWKRIKRAIIALEHL
jgi:hypothetical protein